MNWRSEQTKTKKKESEKFVRSKSYIRSPFLQRLTLNNYMLTSVLIKIYNSIIYVFFYYPYIHMKPTYAGVDTNFCSYFPLGTPKLQVSTTFIKSQKLKCNFCSAWAVQEHSGRMNPVKMHNTLSSIFLVSTFSASSASASFRRFSSSHRFFIKSTISSSFSWTAVTRVKIMAMPRFSSACRIVSTC